MRGATGEIVQEFPASAALRESRPNGEIVWLTHPRWRELVAGAGLANEIWEVETRSFSSVQETRNGASLADRTAGDDSA